MRHCYTGPKPQKESPIVFDLHETLTYLLSLEDTECGVVFMRNASHVMPYNELYQTALDQSRPVLAGGVLQI